MCSYISDIGSAITTSVCGIASRLRMTPEEEEEEEEETIALTSWGALTRYFYDIEYTNNENRNNDTTQTNM